jgi:hypothetical protein
MLKIYEVDNYMHFDVLLSARGAGKLPTGAAWAIYQLLRAFHTHSPSDLFIQVKKDHVKTFIDKIRMPGFFADAELESSYIEQLKQVVNTLVHRATLHHLKELLNFIARLRLDRSF